MITCGSINPSPSTKDFAPQLLPNVGQVGLPLTSNDVQKSTPTRTSNAVQKSTPSNLQTYLETGEFFDFTIKFREKEYKVHKIILASQSSVFKKMFDKERSNELKSLKYCSQKAFAIFLNFFYSGNLESDDDCMLEVLELAVQFEVTCLKKKCEEKLEVSGYMVDNLELIDEIFATKLHLEKLLKKSKDGA